MKNLIFIIRHHKTSFFILMLAGLLSNAVMTLLNPLFLKYVFDEGVIKKDFKLFIVMSIGFILLATAFRFFNMFYSLNVQKIKNRILKDFADRMLSKYYRLPYLEVINRDSGYYASRIYDEPLAASSTTIDLTLDIANAAVSFTVAFLVVIFISLKATIILVCSVPFLIFLGKKYGINIKKHSHDEKERESGLRGFITKAVQAYRTVNIFGLKRSVFVQLNGCLDKYIVSSFARFKGTCIHNTLGSICMSYAEMLVVMVCGYEILRNKMTFGDFMAFMNAFWLAVGGMRSLMQKVPEVSRNSAVVQRVREFENMKEITQIAVATGTSVVLENIDFKYGNKEVLRGLNLKIDKGEKVAFIGKNGSGKSTVANIISGFLLPEKGNMHIAGITHTSACIMPHCFIPGTLSDNLDVNLHDKEKRLLLSKILHDFELEELLEQNPESFSAGQKKKAEVAMGLLKDADLYVFDEPLANIDADSKIKIMNHIFERAKDRTLIVIMHGENELLGRFDRVVELPDADKLKSILEEKTYDSK